MDYDANELLSIGAALHEPEDTYLLLQMLEANDFVHNEARLIYRTISDLVNAKRPVNEKTVLEAVSVSSQANVALYAFMNLALLHSRGVDAQHYMSLVKGEGIRRKCSQILFQAQERLKSDAFDAESYILDQQMQLARLVITDRKRERSLKETLACFDRGLSYQDWITEQVKRKRAGVETIDGFSTGYKYLDKAINGFERGTYTIIGATTSSGKTTYLINLIMNLAARYPGITIVFYTLEMSIPQLTHKLIGSYCGILPTNVKSGDLNEEEIGRVRHAVSQLQKVNIIFNNETPATEQSIRNNFRHSVLKDKADIMFLDYITMVKSYNRYNSRHLEIDSISSTLHDMCLEFHVPVIALAQLNREISRRNDKKPLLSDLRESGSLEEHADNVLLLHRPKKYDASKADTTQVFVAKNRHDPALGSLEYTYEFGRLIEMSPLQNVLQANMTCEESTKEYRSFYD